MKEYNANAGQTYIPFKENIKIETNEFTPLDKPNPEIEELQLNQTALDNKWRIINQSQHFIPGVSVEMMDWFWANMEKGYYLWAPGSHKRFNWVKSPSEYGFINSIHMISESIGAGHPAFGGNGIEIHRLPLSYFPFTKALEHVIVEGTFNDLNEFVDMTVHMWDGCDGGIRHITSAVESTTIHEPPHFVKEMMVENPNAKLVPPSSTDHCEYEASQWPLFLPQLYNLWKNHPDPSQNVPCDLSVKLEAGHYEYIHENGRIEI